MRRKHAVRLTDDTLEIVPVMGDKFLVGHCEKLVIQRGEIERRG